MCWHSLSCSLSLTHSSARVFCLQEHVHGTSGIVYNLALIEQHTIPPDRWTKIELKSFRVFGNCAKVFPYSFFCRILTILHMIPSESLLPFPVPVWGLSFQYVQWRIAGRGDAFYETKATAYWRLRYFWRFTWTVDYLDFTTLWLPSTLSGCQSVRPT